MALLWVVTPGTDVPEHGGIKVRSKCGSLPTELRAVTHMTTVKSGFDSRQGRQEFLRFHHYIQPVFAAQPCYARVATWIIRSELKVSTSIHLLPRLT